MNLYDYGDLVRCQGTFTDSDDAAQDPTAVYIQVKNPSGTSTTYTYGVSTQVVRSGVGVYYMDVSATSVGRWFFRVYSTGTGQAAEEQAFEVGPSEFD